MNANQANLSVRTLCRVLGVSPSGYYDWLDRPPRRRSIDDAVLVERIRKVHTDSGGVYGQPRMRIDRAGNRYGDDWFQSTADVVRPSVARHHRRRLSAVLGAKLGEDLADMGLHRLRGDA